MAGDDKTKDGPKRPIIHINEQGLGPMVMSILEDCLHNIIHDTVLSTYRTEKVLRMQSAAVEVELLATKSGAPPVTPSSNNPTPSKQSGLNPNPGVIATKVSSDAATYDHGQIFLKGNPLKNLKDNYCPNCKLPRLMFPLVGHGSRPPENLNRDFCTLHPFIRKDQHDIYGNPFPISQEGKTKKEKEALRKAERQAKDNTPGSNDTGNPDDASAGGDIPNISKLLPGGKAATYVPWHTCPQCKRSLLINKFAIHLEKCMGIGGRASRNVAAARIAGTNGSGSGYGSTAGSRMGTPAPTTNGAQNNKKRSASVSATDGDEGPPKKKKKPAKDLAKKAAAAKKADDDKDKKGSSISLSVDGKKSSSTNSTKSKPKKLTNGDREANSSTPKKRDRDADESTGAPQPKKKKTAAAAPAAATMSREDSEITLGSPL